MERKKRIAVSGIVALVMFFLVLGPVMSFNGAVTISNSGSIAVQPLLTGLPAADVYVVRDANAGNYVTINGSNTKQVLQTNTNPVTALNNVLAGTTWLPLNGKLVTNGTWPDYSGTVAPGRGNFTWEGWKTRITQTSTSTSWIAGVNVAYNFVTFNNLTYIGRNSTDEIGIRTWQANYFTIENCTITGCYGWLSTAAGMMLNGGVGASIRYNNVSFNYGSWAIALNNMNDSIISHNYCNASGNGGCIGDWGYNGSECQNVNVTFNTCYDWGENPYRSLSNRRHGFYNSGTAYSYIYNNTFSDSWAVCGAAIGMKSFENYVFNNTILPMSGDWAVTMFQQDGAGAEWWLAPNNTQFFSNYIGTNSVGGFVMTSSEYAQGNMTIANNTFVNCHVGIEASSDTTANPGVFPENMTYIGNTFTGCTWPINLGYSGSPNQWIVNNIDILNNSIVGGTYGISIWSTTAVNCTIWYNTFSGSFGISPMYDDSPSGTTTYRFNVGLTGYYLLNVTVVGSGSTSPRGLGWQYKSGSTASVTWTPNAGYVRQNISIDGTNQNTTVSPLNVTMSANHVVIAYFASGP